ncbi:MAG: hypothetical protein H0T77_15660 [Pyrinomonadaceae bacterium]|nr:hypothetical protein [Pyrinomonadaceae bacterium]
MHEVLDYPAVIKTLRRSMTAPARKDDIVELLAEAQESRRARQAFEWEVTRRRFERRGAAIPGHRI